MKTTDTTNAAGSPRTPEAHQRAGGNGHSHSHSFEQNRILFLNMMGAAAEAAEMREWLFFGEGITAPTSIRCSVMIAILAERDKAAFFLACLGGLAAAW